MLPPDGYEFNYLQDAAKYYWAARGLELNYRSIDEKDKLVDQLIIRRLRTLADNLVQQALTGLKAKCIEGSPAANMDMYKELLGVKDEDNK